MPTNHLPLGPLMPNAQTRAPPPQENSSRWRTQLARGSEARAYEAAETEFVTRLLAFMVQNNLEEYKKMNPDFGVSGYPLARMRSGWPGAEICLFRNSTRRDREERLLSRIGRWICSRRWCMNLRIKLWPMICCVSKMGRAIRKSPSSIYGRYLKRLARSRYKFQSAVGAYEDKTAILSDADTVWTEVRHMHMREAIDKLMADFNKFLVDNAVFKG